MTDEGVAALLNDLRDEHDALDDVVGSLSDEQWDAPTPAPGWAVRHQLSHLTYFDEQGALAASDPEAFEAGRDAWIASGDLDTRGDTFALPRSEALARWRDARGRLVAGLDGFDPKARLPWYGPPMSARSFITARLMETWAHGHDAAEGVGASLPATARLRHIAHLGVVTRGWSYVVRGEEAPAVDIRVELAPPGGGEPWTWGDASSADRVDGDALEFCLVVTQRRALDDTSVAATPGAAAEWMARAQAFAGGPTTITRRRSP